MPIPISPYHFYEKDGLKIRESRNSTKVTVEVEVDGQYLTVIQNAGSQEAIDALTNYISRQKSIKNAF